MCGGTRSTSTGAGEVRMAETTNIGVRRDKWEHPVFGCRKVALAITLLSLCMI